MTTVNHVQWSQQGFKEHCFSFFTHSGVQKQCNYFLPFTQQHGVAQRCYNIMK